MKLQFIGTGAADFDWSRYGEKNISGSCATLIDDHILIDCGTTTAKALERFNNQIALQYFQLLYKRLLSVLTIFYDFYNHKTQLRSLLSFLPNHKALDMSLCNLAL